MLIKISEDGYPLYPLKTRHLTLFTPFTPFRETFTQFINTSSETECIACGMESFL